MADHTLDSQLLSAYDVITAGDRFCSFIIPYPGHGPYTGENPIFQRHAAAARQAALDYYAGTVFEVDALTEIEPRQGEITFQVSCSKGGVKVDPDRTISLERKNGAWSVVSEGY